MLFYFAHLMFNIFFGVSEHQLRVQITVHDGELLATFVVSQKLKKLPLVNVEKRA